MDESRYEDEFARELLDCGYDPGQIDHFRGLAEQALFARLIAAAEEENWVYLDDGMVPEDLILFREWMEQQQKAMTDGSEEQ